MNVFIPKNNKWAVVFSVFFMSALLIFLSSPAPSYAAEKKVRAVPELEEGMSQCDLARWLVYAIGATRSQGCGPGPEKFGKIPPAHQGRDASEFIDELGVTSDEGWDYTCEQPVTRQWLAGLLDKPEEVQNLVSATDRESFIELVTKVKNRASSIYEKVCKTYGTFRIIDTPFEGL